MKHVLTEIPFWPPVRVFLVACLGWVFLAPLTFLVPRRRGLTVFFGRDGGKFTDNCKHLFATLVGSPVPGIEPVFLAKDALLRNQLLSLGARTATANSLAGMWLILRAETLVVDSIDWIDCGRISASRGTRVVQLWHGIPLKQLQLPLFEERLRRLPGIFRWPLRVQRAVIGRFAPSAWFLSTSRFVTELAFSSSFKYTRLSHAGYPRNDVLFNEPSPLAELGIDERAKQAIAGFRSGRRRVGVYAPTFRDAFEDPFATGRIDPQSLSRIACDLDLLLLVKLHPWMHGKLSSQDLPNLMFISPESDVYPMLREVDFLITDYSSIAFDFLLLDRPLVFFPYDLDYYLASERPMYFDYAEMTPGPKALDMRALADALTEVVAGVDSWKNERARVRRLVFDFPDGNAARRLLAELFSTPPPSLRELKHVAKSDQAD